MLLDLKMPGVDGVAVLRQSADIAPETQVVVFTAHGSMESAIQAVRHGAYDYLLKPASTAEVVACITRAAERGQQRARERRLIEDPTSAFLEGRLADGGEDRVEWSNVVLETRTRRLSGPRGELELTPAELRLLVSLLRRPGQVAEYTALVNQVQGYRVDAWEAPGMLRPVVSRLREKIRRIGGPAQAISTVRGVGYVLGQVDARQSSDFGR
jgi:DNA-binding response OmpR family regulator